MAVECLHYQPISMPSEKYSLYERSAAGIAPEEQNVISKLVRPYLHYGWIVAAVTFLTMLTAAGMRSTPSVLIIPLEHEFGWSRATISLAISINLVLFGLSGPFAAALMERFGLRRVISAALLIVALAVSL